ncbi:MAG: hypothetical protein HC896_11095 [Bacteroidales bacterium]|nr:hypothetical protein [Bacteroidales bacterium]
MAVAKSQTFTGKVVNAQHEPLFGASVVNSVNGTGVTTSTNGSFSLWASENDSVNIAYLGYYDTTVTASAHYATIVLREKSIWLNETIVSGIRAKFNTPATFSMVTEGEIKEKNVGKDVPFILESQPSVVVSSDAGTGIGYTGLRIRGVSPEKSTLPSTAFR